MSTLPREIDRAAARYGRMVDSLARQRYGVSGETLLRKIAKGESGGRGNAVSSAGARGWMQFMPGTRQAVLRKTGGRVDPWRSAAEAVHAAALHLNGSLGNAKGLEGYNPGMASYPSYILKQQVGPSSVSGGGGGAVSRQEAASMRINTRKISNGSPTEITGGRDVVDKDGAIAAALLRRPKGQSLFEAIQSNLASGQFTTYEPSKIKVGELAQYTTDVDVNSRAAKARLGGSSGGSNGLRPSGGWSGTNGPASYISSIAAKYGLKASGKRDRMNTASGNVSDHYRGNKIATARDMSGSVGQMDNAAVAIARELGIKNYRKGQTLNHNVVKNGLRFQVLYRTNVGGNHYDHIHVGVKRVK